jgi:predicted nucleic acid-binding protein
MLYFDAAYIAKCYLNEPGADLVRDLAQRATGLASSELGRVEFSSVLHRHVREGRLTNKIVKAIWTDFQEDEASGVWSWLPLPTSLLEAVSAHVRSLPRHVAVRAGDAIHLLTAKEHGFAEVYTNDRNMLAAARHFSVKGVNVLGHGLEVGKRWHGHSRKLE